IFLLAASSARADETDLPSIRTQYEAKAKAGDIASALALASRLMLDSPTEAQAKEALGYYRMAAEKGDPSARQCLISAHGYPDNLPASLRDPREAIRYAEAAFAEGDTAAGYFLAERYERGPGIALNPLAPDHRRALAIWQKVATLPDAGYAQIARDRLDALAYSIKYAAKVETARARWEKAALAGDAEAAHQLGSVCADDPGPGAEHHVAALRWLTFAAERRHPAATARLAEMLDVGCNARPERDKSEAIRLYRVAADLGDTGAMTRLADLLSENSDGIPVDPPAALAYARRALEAGDPNAADILARWHRDGKHGAAKSPADEFRLRTLAVELTEKLAAASTPTFPAGYYDSTLRLRLHTLAKLHESGVGTPADPAKALELLLRAKRLDDAVKAAGGSASSPLANDLALVQAAVNKPLTRPEAVSLARAGDEASLSRLRAAAAAGGKEAAEILALRDTAFAKIAALRPAAEKGGASDMAKLAFALGEKWGFAHNPAEAHAWLEKAANAGHVPALDALGFYSLEGTGCPRDRAAAATWWAKAIAAGSTRTGDFHQYLLTNLGAAPLAEQPLPVITFLADLDHREALFLAYRAAITTPRDDSPAAVERRNRWLVRAARLGHPEALYRLSSLLDTSGADTSAAYRFLNPPERAGNIRSETYSVACLENAAAAGHPDAIKIFAYEQNQEVKRTAYLYGWALEITSPLPTLAEDNMNRNQETIARTLGNVHAMLAVGDGFRWKRDGTSDIFSERGDRKPARRWMEFIADGNWDYALHARLKLAIYAELDKDPVEALAHLNKIPQGKLPEADKLRDRYQVAAADTADRAAGRADSDERSLRAAVAADTDNAEAAYALHAYLNGKYFSALQAARPVTGIYMTEFDRTEGESKIAAAKPIEAEARRWLVRAADLHHPLASEIIAEEERRAGDLDSAKRRLQLADAKLESAGVSAGAGARSRLATALAGIAKEQLQRWEKRLVAAESDPAIRFAIALDYHRGTGGVTRDPALAYAWFARPNSAPGAAYNAAVLALSGEAFPASTKKALELLSTDPLSAPGLTLLHRVAEAHAAADSDAEAANRVAASGASIILSAPSQEREFPSDTIAWRTALPELVTRLLAERNAAPSGPAREALDRRLARCAEAVAAWRAAAGRIALEETTRLPLLAASELKLSRAYDSELSAEVYAEARARKPIPTTGTKRVKGGASYEYKGMFYKMENSLSGPDVDVEYTLSTDEITAIRATRDADAALAADARKRKENHGAALRATRAANDAERAALAAARRLAESRAALFAAPPPSPRP
ncbi:MAG: hypothetical protein RIQ79_1616, partial [Verrucomicrobiota bacterium]